MIPFTLEGLDTGPAQTWGSVRLVPLVRDEPVPHLRLHRRAYAEGSPVVDVGDGTSYTSFIPHAFVATYVDGEDPAASYGTRLLDKDLRRPPSRVPVQKTRRMARRVAKDRLRFLPQHLAVEGYLALHFGGPEIAWEEWSRSALSHGLSPRAERAYTGARVQGLEDALRVFEILPGQCGVLVYVLDALAGAFAVPHPDDYRALHATLIEDLYGEQIYQYGLLGLHVQDMAARIDDTSVRSLADLRAQAALRQREWAEFHDDVMAARLFDREGSYKHVQYIDDFVLSRFLPSFALRRENHIGEVITGEGGGVAYLKTFRLSDSQVKRGYLLSRLAAHGWNIADTAAALGTDATGLGLRLERAGFGYLLRKDVLNRYRADARRGRTVQRPKRVTPTRPHAGR
ncbi:ARPP-2 domain-containing protein [Spirillospora sp. NBC_01491]|uniref:ARPP-2 domain-containing protein n=1 Tax=Spirillospora sp. NBC_01491 TaxID=2976007 RepID=UPI002E3821E9|nr:hypothetical protein [Spirillospora sp. NBC_01491]